MSQVEASVTEQLPAGFLAGVMQAGDYQFCPHIVQAVNDICSGPRGSVLLIRRRELGSRLAMWEAVPLADFDKSPLDRLVKAYDPHGSARRPTQDVEHRRLLAYYSLVGSLAQEN